MQVLACLLLHAHTYALILITMLTGTPTHLHTHTHRHARVCTHAHTHTDMYTYTHLHSHRQTDMPTSVHRRAYTHTHTSSFLLMLSIQSPCPPPVLSWVCILRAYMVQLKCLDVNSLSPLPARNPHLSHKAKQETDRAAGLFQMKRSLGSVSTSRDRRKEAGWCSG